jgi:hypothetical protein
MRWLIGRVIKGLGAALGITERIRIATFDWSQKRLRRRYGVTRQTPIFTYGPEIEQRIREAAAEYGDRARFAETSGSTAAPKRILYTKGRLRSVRWTFMDVFARCYRAHRVERTSLYVFGSFAKDSALTSMLLEEKRLPSYLVTLQAPYRVESHTAIQELARRYGVAAVRLWMLTAANPGVLYSTNPSTLFLFLHEAATEWERSRRLIQDIRGKPGMFDPVVHAIARRLESAGSSKRMDRIALSGEPLPLSIWAPAVRIVVCWTGGYVKPFLDRIAAYLPPDRYRLIPMFSMSTETIETISHFDGDTAFLPLGSRVLYEFIEEGRADRSENIITPDALQPMKSYCMIVSDPFGLRRYQTEDVFLCKGFVGRLPDLRFVRRRNLEYSFTGEKLSGDQLDLVFRKLREEFGAIPSDAFLTCIPSHPGGEAIPHYKVILAGEPDGDTTMNDHAIATRCDMLLQEVNIEYRNKRESGRLGNIRFVRLSFDAFTSRFCNAEGQFKFLPLYRRTWEDSRT